MSAASVANADDPPSNKYVWRVKDIEKFKNAENGDYFESEEFTMYGVKWRLDIYPKGDRAGNEEMISLFLRCLDYNGFQNFECDYTLCINELNISQTGSDEFTKPNPAWGWGKFHSNIDFLNLETITIECKIVPKRIDNLLQDLRDIAEARRVSNKYVWRVNESEDFADAAIGDKFESDEFMMFGAKWSLQMYPKGVITSSEYMSLYLNCVDLGSFAEFESDIIIDIDELNIHRDGKRYKFEPSEHFASVLYCRNEILREIEKLTIECTIVCRNIPKYVSNLENSLAAAKIYIPDIAVRPSVDTISKLDPDFRFPPLEPEHTDLYQKHDAIITDWDIDTARLKELQFDEQQSSLYDEKECLAEDTSINEYFESCSIIKRQLKRLHTVETDEHLVELIKHRDVLSVLAKFYEAQCGSDEKEWEASDELYRSLRQQREELQDKIKSLVTDCNALIARENAAVEERDKCSRSLNQHKSEHHKVSASSAQCAVVISRYQCFMEDNKTYIKNINAKFESFWSEFESKWMEWKAENIIAWFKYKTMDMDTDNVDWETVEKQLKKRNITGKSLQKFNDLTFEFLEIHDSESAQHLLSAIDALESQNRQNSEFTEEHIIPERFLCPISKKMMTDPVMAFDGHCYERGAIEEYLKTHGKSPKTGKDADYLIVFPNHRLRADIEEYIKEGKGSEGVSTEGENETSLL